MCWGMLASTMDILALIGIYQGKKKLVLPWLLWWVEKHGKDEITFNIMRYVLEVVTYIAVSLVFIVYTEKVYILPVLAKTVVTIITWINMKRVYKNSFGTFYTKETEAIIYWRNKEIWRVLLDLSCVLKNQRNAWHLMDTWHWIYCGDWCLEWVLQCPDVTSFTLHNVHMFPHQTWAELEWTHDHSSLLTQSYSDTACLTTNHLLIITCKFNACFLH